MASTTFTDLDPSPIMLTGQLKRVSLPTGSTSPVVTKTATAGAGAGVLTVLAALGAAISGHGFNLTDALAALSGAGISLGSVLGLVFHHNAALAHDAAIAVADVPDLSKLRADLDAAQAKLSQFDPSLGARVDGIAASFRQEVATLSADAEKRAGVTPEQVKSLAIEAYRDLLNNIGLNIPQGTSGAQTVTPAAAQAAAAAQVPASVVAPQPAAPTS